MSSATFWPPIDVVPKHRKKATALWITLLAGFVCYILYLCISSVQQSKSPPVKYNFKKKAFPIPDVGVCFYGGTGCAEGNEETCAESAISTSTATLVSSSSNPEVSATIDYEGFPLGNCILLETSKFTSNEQLTSILVAVSWLPTLGADTDVTVEQVQVNFYDSSEPASSRSELANTQYLGYGAVPQGSTDTSSISISSVVLAATHYKALSGSNKWYYDGAFTSGVYKTDALSGLEADLAILFLEMYVTKKQYTEITETNPMSAAVLLGAIGGFWGYVVGIYGLFFVLANRSEPSQKLRTWRKTFQRGMERASAFKSGSYDCTSAGGTIVDASAEDLPPGWCKMQGADGNTFYLDGQGRRYDSPPQTGGVFPKMGTVVAAAEVGVMPPNATYSNGQQNRQPGGMPTAWEEKTDSQRDAYWLDSSSKRNTAERPMQQSITEHPRRKVFQMDMPRRSSSHSRSYSQDSGGPPLPILEGVLSEEDSKETEHPHYSAPAPPQAPQLPPRPPVLNSVHENTQAMPAGWEEKFTPNGRRYYVDHLSRTTAWELPTM